MTDTQKSQNHRFVAMASSVLAVFFLCICISCTLVWSGRVQNERESGTDQSTLELVHVVFRHGPRTPVDTYPTDPYINETFYPTGWGHITNEGKRELFGIGTWLRKRYGNFLAPHYHPDLVHAQATDSARTHMTLQTVLASFFPPKGTAMEWNAKYNWQPIPIYSQPLDQDTLLLVRTSCPRYYEAYNEVLQLPAVKSEIQPYEYLYGELEKLTGVKYKDPEDVQSLYLTLLAEKDFGLQLPEWTKKYFPDKMRFLAEQSYIYKAYTREMQKIKGGPFITKMLKEMEAKRTNTLKPTNRKLFIYTGHDSTIVNVLSAFKIWKRQLPRYSVMAIFELHKDKKTGEHYVEIYFRNDPTASAEKLTVPGCEFQCPLSKLIELSRDVMRNEGDGDVCAARNPSFTEPPPSGP